MRVAADAAQAFVLQGRFEAIRLNESVAVTVDGATVSARAGNCSGEVLRRLSLSDYPQVGMAGEGFIWTPSGEPRTCSGGGLGLGGPRFTVADGRSEAVISVSGGGAVRIE